MLNKSLKLIRTVRGFDVKLASLEINRTPYYVDKIEKGILRIQPGIIDDLSSVYQIPISEIERINTLDDSGYSITEIINEISKYYIIKEYNEVFNLNNMKYVFEKPESPLKLMRIIKGYTMAEVAKMSDVSVSAINKAELLITNPADRTISNLAKIYNMPKEMIEDLMNEQNENASRAELFYLISKYYIGDNYNSIDELKKSLGSIKYAKQNT